MKRIIHKLFWVWDFDKEETWLNEMAKKGLHLTEVGFCKYTFEEGAPEAYSVRLELLDNVITHKKSRAYISFVEETGAEYVGSILRWVYFRKKTAEGSFDLFSDIDSRITHLKRVLLLIGIIGVMELYCGVVNGILQLLENGTSFNLLITVLSLVITLLFVYGFARVFKKYNRLKKERIWHE
ncbi:MAG TPA: DUF2812 domain-containing protein [Clostridiales bacterium]|nr:DUF2812 domain-containing protein [Clostridiales bacterium]